MASADLGPGRGTVLVVEDDPASAELLAELLHDEGFLPVLCADGRTALEPFVRRRPVAVLIDWVIPGGSGIELCRRMRSLDPVVPIFFVSGRADEASVSRGLEAGADDFLSKPVRPRELAARLDAHLRKVAALPAGTPAPEEQVPAYAPLSDTRTFGDVDIDLEARMAQVRGRPVTLGSL